MDEGVLLHKRKSEDLQRKRSVACIGDGCRLDTQKNGCGNHRVAAAVSAFLKNFVGDGQCGGKAIQIFLRTQCESVPCHPTREPESSSCIVLLMPRAETASETTDMREGR